MVEAVDVAEYGEVDVFESRHYGSELGMNQLAVNSSLTDRQDALRTRFIENW